MLIKQQGKIVLTKQMLDSIPPEDREVGVEYLVVDGMDAAPRAGSSVPVTSDGIHRALATLRTSILEDVGPGGNFTIKSSPLYIQGEQLTEVGACLWYGEVDPAIHTISIEEGMSGSLPLAYLHLAVEAPTLVASKEIIDTICSAGIISMVMKSDNFGLPLSTLSNFRFEGPLESRAISYTFSGANSPLLLIKLQRTSDTQISVVSSKDLTSSLSGDVSAKSVSFTSTTGLESENVGDALDELNTNAVVKCRVIEHLFPVFSDTLKEVETRTVYSYVGNQDPGQVICNLPSFSEEEGAEPMQLPLPLAVGVLLLLGSFAASFVNEDVLTKLMLHPIKDLTIFESTESGQLILQCTDLSYSIDRLETRTGSYEISPDSTVELEDNIVKVHSITNYTEYGQVELPEGSYTVIGNTITFSPGISGQVYIVYSTDSRKYLILKGNCLSIDNGGWTSVTIEASLDNGEIAVDIREANIEDKLDRVWDSDNQYKVYGINPYNEQVMLPTTDLAGKDGTAEFRVPGEGGETVIPLSYRYIGKDIGKDLKTFEFDGSPFASAPLFAGLFVFAVNGAPEFSDSYVYVSREEFRRTAFLRDYLRIGDEEIKILSQSFVETEDRMETSYLALIADTINDIRFIWTGEHDPIMLSCIPILFGGSQGFYTEVVLQSDEGWVQQDDYYYLDKELSEITSQHNPLISLVIPPGTSASTVRELQADFAQVYKVDTMDGWLRFYAFQPTTIQITIGVKVV